LHIFDIKDPKTYHKIIYLGTVATEDWNYIPDYLKIPNGLLFYKRGQKIEMNPDGKSFKFSESTLRLIWLKLPNMEEIEMSEFNIHENRNRFNLYFLRQIFSGERFVSFMKRQEG
jgi:hypothetical protein